MDVTPRISIVGNGGPFYLLADNVIPYSVTSEDKVVMTISKIGKGLVGFIGGEYFVNPEYQEILKDFYAKIYGTDKIKPEVVTKQYLKSLESEWKVGESLKKSAIWSAHKTLGKDNVDLLLKMVRDGLNLIVGIKPWAYNHYTNKLRTSEIRGLFLAAGLWPSIKSISGDLRIVKTTEYKLLPLVYLLEYAKINKTAAASVSDLIKDSFENIPYSEFSDDPSGVALMCKLKLKINELYSLYRTLIKSIVPCLSAPLTDKENRLFLELYNTILINTLGNNFTAPGINFYPGTINLATIATESVRIKLKLPLNDEKYFVGVFIPVSQSVVATVKTSKSKVCTLYVNFQLLTLTDWDNWKKWPTTVTSYNIEPDKTLTFSNSFGGLLSIECDTIDDDVELTLSNVLRVPMFDLRNGPVSDTWSELKKRPIPWAILASDTLVFGVPKIAIRNLEDPEPIMKLWDKMIKEQFYLRGRSVPATRRELISTDIQIKAGYMHAGYPIGTFIQHVANPAVRSKYLFGVEKLLKEGYWGVNHEVGHNLQERIFTFSGTTDVTNNIFTLVANEAIAGVSPWNDTHGWVTENRLPNLIRHINKENFSFWQDEPFVGLGTYAQLQAAFGWEFYRQIFRRYNTIISEYGERAYSMASDDRIQLWIFETSNLVKMNLVPLYDYWKWPIKEDTTKSLSKYPPFLPDDFLTKMTETKVKEIIAKYGGETIVSRKPLVLPIIVGPLKDSLKIEGAQIIKEITVLS